MKNHARPKVFLIRRRYLNTAFLIFCVFAIFYILTHPALVGTSPGPRAVPIYSVLREDQAIGLSFNLSSPEDEHSIHVKNILDALGVRATFFVTGDWVRANHDTALNLLASGHELMNLSDDHQPLRPLSLEDQRANIQACSEAIFDLSGQTPTIFRAPYGQHDDRLVNLAASMGKITVQWSIDSGDWRGLSSDAITRQVLGRSFSGGVVLLHANLEQTAIALPDIIRGLQEAGYEILPLSQLIYQGEFVVSLTGRQVPV